MRLGRISLSPLQQFMLSVAAGSSGLFSACTLLVFVGVNDPKVVVNVAVTATVTPFALTLLVFLLLHYVSERRFEREVRELTEEEER